MGADVGHVEDEESLGEIFDEINLFEYIRHSEPTAEEREAHESYGPMRDWTEPPGMELSVRARNEIRMACVTKSRVMSCPDRESLDRLFLPPWAIEELAANMVRLAAWPVVAEVGEPGTDHAWPTSPEPKGDQCYLYPLLVRDIRWEVEHLPGGGRTLHPEPGPTDGDPSERYAYIYSIRVYHSRVIVHRGNASSSRSVATAETVERR